MVAIKADRLRQPAKLNTLTASEMHQMRSVLMSLANGAVDTAPSLWKFTPEKIQANKLQAGQIASGIGESELANNLSTNAVIDGSITPAKIQANSLGAGRSHQRIGAELAKQFSVDTNAVNGSITHQKSRPNSLGSGQARGYWYHQLADSSVTNAKSPGCWRINFRP